MMSNKWYDRLKWLLILAVPALMTAYTQLGELYGIEPETINRVVSSVNIVATLAGTLIGVSNYQYLKGDEQK